MYDRKYNIIIFFLFLFINVKAQEQRIAAIVSDSKGKGIPYASIYGNHNLLAISEPDGKFIISIAKNELIDTLYISSIGYVSTSVPLTKNLQQITLKESDQILEEVSVKALNFTDQLLQDCLNNGIDTTAVSGTLLCRQYLKLDGLYKRFSEGVFNYHIDGKPTKKVILDLLNARTLDNLEVKNQGLGKMKYGINIRVAIQQPFLLFRRNIMDKVYHFNLIGKSKIDGVNCYKIIFSFDKKVDVPKNTRFFIGGGTMYITCDSHLLKSLDRNLISPDLKKRWFTKELYEVGKVKSHLNYIELTSEIITGSNAKRKPMGGLSIQFKSVPDVKPIDVFSDDKESQDLSNHVKAYNIHFWKEYYTLFGAHFPADVLQAFSKIGELDPQFGQAADFKK
ncbi:hypothetical protein OQX63_15100 [Pedobacter sp. PF22-3]|uniref:hypothetical protein n=1 Tax=Pedobacter sp. PF22-3 TaxID=2994467 RepID=UPI0022463CF5|nr:hypothetical protein [Pedobacter sp. PF22-3]MCX2494814.1 hypothetical protein [Pedobacter sp. PF22-3]